MFSVLSANLRQVLKLCAQPRGRNMMQSTFFYRISLKQMQNGRGRFQNLPFSEWELFPFLGILHVRF